MKYDKRSFCEFFVENIFKYHVILSLFQKSLIIPIEIRVLRLFLQISLNFTMNAIFFSDEYIQARGGNIYDKEKSGFLYSVWNEFPKTLISAIIGNSVLLITRLIIIIPKREKFYFNKALKTKNTFVIEMI